MNAQSAASNSPPNGPVFGHAVVIGGSIAGLTAARVLSDHFARVTVLERDHLPEAPEFRSGAPQARHIHTLPLRGQAILEGYFPGLAAELLASGATSIHDSGQVAFFRAGGWHALRDHSAIMSISFSRPLLENVLVRRVAALPGVHIVQESDVVGLRVDETGQRVSGVRWRPRHTQAVHEVELAADLVVDASGRDSRAPQWLASLGYTPPQETTVNAFAGYATRIYQRPGGFAADWVTMHIKPTPPDSSRGGVIIPIEGDRWHVTLAGMGGDYPPIDEQGFMDFARSLPSPRLDQAIQAAEPLTKPYGYRRGENRLRHYDKLPRYLEGFLVYGDAVLVLNPVYAQGMTMVALGSLALEHSLAAHVHQGGTGGLVGLAGSFQKQLSRVTASAWQMVTREDRRWPAAETVDHVSSTARQRTPALPMRPALA